MATKFMSVSMVMMIALCLMQDHQVLGNNACESIQSTEASPRKCVPEGCVQTSCYSFHVSTELDVACMDHYNTETDTGIYECCEYSATSCPVVNGVRRDSFDDSPIKRFLDRTARRQQRRQRFY